MTRWNNGKYGSRGVTERIFIQGRLHLDTPAHFGGSETEGSTDMPLLYDTKENRRPLLTGASIAGALRNYLREYEKGYRWPENQKAIEKSWAEKLFGHLDDQLGENTNTRRQHASVQSWLIVDDALGEPPAAGDPTEIRDGVSIDPKTRTAEPGKKFDVELLSAGTTFTLSFELWLNAAEPGLLEALAIALRGLEQGEIGLGMRKRRGYGHCHVSGWQLSRYKMNEPAQIVGWLTYDFDASPAFKPDICGLLGLTPSLTSQRTAFHLQASFALNGSLFIRSYGNEKNSADAVHIRSWRDGEEKPVLPGTSLTGALRGRALKIANTLAAKPGKGKALVDDLFGRRIESYGDEPGGSRLLVQEIILEPETVVTNLVQNRVSIDRFTGGARDTALFNEQPVWGKPETRITLDLQLINPTLCEIGLLLLLLKDLWTEDLPLGGESSVGRGRLQGKEARLTYSYPGAEPIKWVIQDNDNQLKIEGSRDVLESCVKWLNAYLQEVGHG
jgi:CRISPR/Cas system CSM-associated protein Csm3 (group 7 of RAMP superfamily)